MAQVSAGVVGQAQLNGGMSMLNGGGSQTSAVQWAMAWFVMAVAFILFIYFGFGGLRGQVAS